MGKQALRRAGCVAAVVVFFLVGCTTAPAPPAMQTRQEVLRARPGKKKPPLPPSHDSLSAPHTAPKAPHEKRDDIGGPPPAAPKSSTHAEPPGNDPDELALAASLQKLDQGKVAYSTPVSMFTGQSATVVAHIGGSHVTSLTGGMPSSPGSTIDTAPTPVSTRMKMSLRSADFDITPLSTEEQEVGGAMPTEWEWTILPKHAGQLQLHLAATVELQDLSRDFVSIDRDVQVQVNKRGAVEQFIANNWQWLLGTLGTGLIALWRFLASRRKAASAASRPPEP